MYSEEITSGILEYFAGILERKQPGRIAQLVSLSLSFCQYLNSLMSFKTKDVSIFNDNSHSMHFSHRCVIMHLHDKKTTAVVIARMFLDSFASKRREVSVKQKY